jgi:hypothetical protein
MLNAASAICAVKLTDKTAVARIRQWRRDLAPVPTAAGLRMVIARVIDGYLEAHAGMPAAAISEVLEGLADFIRESRP